MGDVSNALEVDDAGISTSACYYQLGLAFFNLGLQCFIVQHFSFRIHAIVYHVVICTRNVNRGSMGQMATLGQIHAHHGVARL